VPDETVPGGIGGVLATVHEITDKVIGERRNAVLRDLGARSAEPATAEQACAIAAEALTRHVRDIPFALLYLVDPGRTHARLAGTAGVEVGADSPLRDMALACAGSTQLWPLAQTLESEDIQLVENVGAAIAQLPCGPWSEPPRRACVVPVRSNIPHRLAGFLVAGISPRLRFDQGYRDFLELVSAQIATTIARARSYEEERRRAEALAEIDRAKTSFFSNVSHEFRTPLTLMLGPLQDLLAKEPGALPREVRGELEVVSRNGARLLRLVNALLDFARIEGGRVRASCQPTDLATLTTDLASSFRSATEQAGLTLAIDCRALPLPVCVDRDMWERIVLNLLSNAFKFTFEGGIALTLQQAGETVELQVRDTGVGIPEEELPRIFERFHRVNNARSRTHEGSGIGLALVQELVKLHGGTVRLESAVGRGSTFIVTVPLRQEPLAAEPGNAAPGSAVLAAAPFVEEALRWLPDASSLATPASAADSEPRPAPATESAGSSDRPRVLIADDNADMRQYLSRLLAERYQVQALADGQQALAAVRAQPPDLIVSDIMMPNLDGFGLLRQLRADPRTRTLPIILLSARAGEDSRVEGLDAGADDYLVKPFGARELLARVQVHLELARIRRDAERAVRESEERLQLALSAGKFGHWQLSLPGLTLSASEQCRADFGRAADEPFSYETLTDAIHPDDRERVAAAVTRAIAERGGFEATCSCLWPDGSIHNVLARGRVHCDARGDPDRVVGTTLEITERKRAENLLIEQNRLLELIARGRPLDECLHAVTESVTRLQPGLRAGVVMADESRKWVERVVASRLPSAFGAALQNIPIDAQPIGTCSTAIYRGQPVSCNDIAGNGEWSEPWRALCARHGVHGVHSSPVWGADGNAVASFFICFAEAREPSAWERDLAQFGAHVGSLAIERARAEGALRRSEQRFRTLFESIDEGFCVLEKVWGAPGEPPDFRYLQANPGFAAQTGVDDVVGRTVREVFPGEPEQWLLNYDHILRSGESRKFEHGHLSQGRVLDVYAFRVEDGTQSRIALICKDITGRKRAEAFMLCQKDAFEKAAAGMPLMEVLESLARRMEMHLGDQPLVAIHLLDTSGTRFAHTAAPSLPPDYRGVVAADELSCAADPCCVAVTRGERVAVTDAATSGEFPGYAAFAARHQLRSGWFLPIHSSEGRPLGAFACHYAATRRPQMRDSLLGGIMTRTASIIIERKQVEEMLRQRSAQFEILLNQAPLGVYLVDGDLRIRQVNPIARPAFGAIADLEGRDFSEVMHLLREKDYADEIVRTFRTTLETGDSYHASERARPRLDGTGNDYFEWRIDRIPLPEGGHGVVCYFRDISLEVQARSALQEARDHLESRVRERTEELEQAYKSLRVLSVRMMQMQDEDRRRIARDLHDSAGQLVAALGMELAALNLRAATIAPALGKDIAATNQLVQQLTQEIRTASYLLHPPLLDDAGLSGALRWYVSGLSKRSGIAITLELDEELGRLPRELEAAVFHIVQESLMNIHRHSGSKTAALRITRHDGQVFLEIADQGIGIPSDRLRDVQTQGSGVGIAGMRERVLHFNGDMRITSSSAGTRIAVSFPAPADGETEQPCAAVPAAVSAAEPSAAGAARPGVSLQS
jgi:PAS domain S-box-containing protein